MSSGGAYRKWGKRVVDVALALLALLVLSPAAAVTAALVRSKLGRPVLFRQLRTGRYGKPFTMYKFRTMREIAGRDGILASDTDRLGPLGRFLRSTSLDEIPELINVLRGEMSLVGPRPLLPHYMPFYRATERYRFAVRPGITGWAQVRGRNDATWDDRLTADAWYVGHHSLSLDLRILMTTVIQVIRRTGVQTDPRSLMPDLDVERSEQRSTGAEDHPAKQARESSQA